MRTKFRRSADTSQPHTYPPWLDSFLIRPRNRVNILNLVFSAKDNSSREEIKVRGKDLDKYVKPEVGRLSHKYPSYSLHAVIEIDGNHTKKEVLVARVSQGVLVRVNSINTALESLGILNRSHPRRPAPAPDQ